MWDEEDADEGFILRSLESSQRVLALPILDLWRMLKGFVMARNRENEQVKFRVKARSVVGLMAVRVLLLGVVIAGSPLEVIMVGLPLELPRVFSSLMAILWTACRLPWQYLPACPTKIRQNFAELRIHLGRLEKSNEIFERGPLM